MIIRSDIFPKMGELGFGSREDILIVWVKEAYLPFTSHFSSQSQFVDLLNSIQPTENAELFIRFCQFYSVSKTRVRHPFTKLIMMLSVIEAIISMGRTYRPFKDWIMGQNELIESRLDELKKGDVKTFKKIMEDFKTLYHEKFSSTRNVIEFFNNYFSEQDKVNIIKSFCYKRTDVVSEYSEKLWKNLSHMHVEEFGDLAERGFRISEDELMPLCYNWRNCYLDYVRCHPDNMDCMLKEDGELLFRYLKKVINMIYTMRSNFVHDAKFPPFGEDGINFVGGVYKGKAIIIELNMGHFEELFEKGFLKYFQTHI